MIGTLLLTLVLCQPAPAPPKPVPAVVAKAAITQRDGKLFPASIKAKALYLSAKTSTRGPGNVVKWIVNPPQYRIDAEKFEEGSTLVVPIGDVEAHLQIYQIVAKGDQSDAAELNIVVNPGGPRPPPVPPTPIPPVPVPPVPVPPVPVQQKLHVTVFRKSSEMTPAVANVLNDQTMRKAILDKGHAFRIFDADSDVDERLQFSTVIANAGGTPCLILQAANGKVVAAMKLPTTTAGVLDEIRKAGG